MNCSCIICGQKFFCGFLARSTKCWCATLAPRKVIDEYSKGCFCPSCINIKAKPPLKNVTWRLSVAYKGTIFHGFQQQDGLNTIQGSLCAALKKITKNKISLIVAGRTDAGVHAQGQVISCTFVSRFTSEKLVLALNSVLPSEISVYKAEQVFSDFNARRHSIGKKYIYTIFTRSAKDPFFSDTSWHLKGPLDIEKMNQAAQYLIGDHDFNSFRSSSCTSSHARRFLWKVFISTKKEHKISIDIRGNAFCHNMVRIIVGTLVEVGKRTIKPEDLKIILESKSRVMAKRTAPAKGLSLWQVYYPDNLSEAEIPQGAQFPRFPLKDNSFTLQMPNKH